MRLVLQRVTEAAVRINGELRGQIGPGLLVLAGIATADTAADVQWLSKKTAQLRIFGDEAGKMNRNLIDSGGNILLVSQFTLLASTRKGNRPSFTQAAPPAVAVPLYEQLIAALEQELGRKIQTGIFGADMQVSLVNDGPVTIILDSPA